MRCLLLWYFMQCWLVVSYLCFGTAYCSFLQGSSSLRRLGLLDPWRWDRLSMLSNIPEERRHSFSPFNDSVRHRTKRVKWDRRNKWIVRRWWWIISVCVCLVSVWADGKHEHYVRVTEFQPAFLLNRWSPLHQPTSSCVGGQLWLWTHTCAYTHAHANTPKCVEMKHNSQTEYKKTMIEVFSMFFLSCKGNARV